MPDLTDDILTELESAIARVGDTPDGDFLKRIRNLLNWLVKERDRLCAELDTAYGWERQRWERARKAFGAVERSEEEGEGGQGA